MKAKMNDIVYYAHHWNSCNVGMVEEIVITSWGKKRGTAKHLHNGVKLNKTFWLDDGDYAQVFATRAEAVAYNRVELIKSLPLQVFRTVRDINNDLAKNIEPNKYTVEALDDFLENGIYSVDYEEEMIEIK